MTQMGPDGNRGEQLSNIEKTEGGSPTCHGAIETPVVEPTKIFESLRRPSLQAALFHTEDPEVRSLIVPFLQLLETKEIQEQLVHLKQGDIVKMFVSEVSQMRERRNAVFQELSGVQRFFVTITSGMYMPRPLASFDQEAAQLLEKLLDNLLGQGLIKASGFTGYVAQTAHGVGTFFVSYRETGIHLTENGRALLSRES